MIEDVTLHREMPAEPEETVTHGAIAHSEFRPQPVPLASWIIVGIRRIQRKIGENAKDFAPIAK